VQEEIYKQLIFYLGCKSIDLLLALVKTLQKMYCTVSNYPCKRGTGAVHTVDWLVDDIGEMTMYFYNAQLSLEGNFIKLKS
jgi:hypothetical protein